ncbi:MAG: ECF transporter S component [Clostridiales bacterium]|nr:ECF transporter S component [Clostridiales bacterium]
MNKHPALALTRCAAMAALVMALTSFPKVPVSATGGYVHLGDAAIFAAVTLLGPSGIAAAAIGSALADLLGGYLVYALPTALIKAAMAAVACFFPMKKHRLPAFLLAAAVMVLGYFVAESLLYGPAAALSAVLPNLVQGLTGAVLALLMMPWLLRLKHHLKSSNLV